jgi:general secretion pathway protein K
VLKNNNKGIALLITLTIITVLVAVAFELNRQVGYSVSSSGASRDRLVLRHRIDSGISLAKAVLVEDKQKTEVDSVQEDWANPEKIKEIIYQAGFTEDELSIVITDELSRLQVNALVLFPEGRQFQPHQRELWLRFLDMLIASRDQDDSMSVLSEPLEPDMIINPVKDWLDSEDDDAITGLSGAESDYYLSLDPPYKCRNGPFRHVSEILYVRNIDPELFYHMDENLGISSFITVHGIKPAPANRHDLSYEGKININTADIPVLAALLPMGYEFLAPELAALREETAGDEYVYDLTSPSWYKQVPGLEDAEIDPSLITVKSDLFRIQCETRLNESRMAATVIVERQQDSDTGRWKCVVLNWEYK